MSTKASIASGKTWHLYHEMMDDSVRVGLNDAAAAEIHIKGRWHAVIVTLPPDVLDAIATAHSANSLPHQVRPKV